MGTIEPSLVVVSPRKDAAGSHPGELTASQDFPSPTLLAACHRANRAWWYWHRGPPARHHVDAVGGAAFRFAPVVGQRFTIIQCASDLPYILRRGHRINSRKTGAPHHPEDACLVPDVAAALLGHVLERLVAAAINAGPNLRPLHRRRRCPLLDGWRERRDRRLGNWRGPEGMRRHGRYPAPTHRMAPCGRATPREHKTAPEAQGSPIGGPRHRRTTSRRRQGWAREAACQGQP